jgi:hypothetical protein
MRKLSALFGAALLALAGAANAQTCLQFDNFCDAVQLDAIGEFGIQAQWSSWDCAGSDAPMVGGRFGNGGAFGIVTCTDASCPFGEDWVFGLAFPIASFWLSSITTGQVFVVEGPYTQIAGACTNAPNRSGRVLHRRLILPAAEVIRQRPALPPERPPGRNAGRPLSYPAPCQISRRSPRASRPRS